MGWGTIFTPEVYISKEHYNSLEDIQEKIKEEEENINESKEAIAMLVAATPKDIVEQDSEDVISSLRFKLMEYHESIAESSRKLCLLQLLEEYVQENGIEKVIKY